MEENGIQASKRRARSKKLLYLMFLVVVILLPQITLCTDASEKVNQGQQGAYNSAKKLIEGMLDCVKNGEEIGSDESDCFKRTLFSGMGDLLKQAYTSEMDNVRLQKAAEQIMELEEKLEIATGEKVSLQNEIQEKEKAIESLENENLRLIRDHGIFVENKTLETDMLKINLENCYSERKVLEEDLSNFKINSTEEATNGGDFQQEFDELKNFTSCHDSESLGMIKNLIKGGADIYAQNSKGYTVLHNLVKGGTSLTPCQFHAIAEFLISKNLSSIFNTKGRFTIKGNTNTSRYEFIMEDSTPLQLAVKNLEVENRTLTLLRENSVNFNSVDGNGHSVLHYAIFGHRSVELLSELVEVGANWKYTNLRNNNWSLLHYAVESGTIEQIKFFVDLGLDINIRTSFDSTPLHRAICWRSKNLLQVVQILIENGADVKARTKDNKTPLDDVTYCDNPSSDKDKAKVIELLTQT